MATYSNDLRLKEITPGDEDGVWGTSTNNNWNIAAEAFSYGTTELASDANATLTIPDGISSAYRSLFLKITSAVSLTATRQITLAPSTVSKLWFIQNSTSGDQTLTIKQGSGATVDIPNGKSKIVYTDGGGAVGAVTDAMAAFSAFTTGLQYVGTTTGTANTYAVTIADVTAYVNFLSLVVQINVTNTGASTINVSSLGAKDIRRPDGTALEAGDLTINTLVGMRYNSAAGYFVLVAASAAELESYVTAAAASASAASSSASAASASASSASSSASAASASASAASGSASSASASAAAAAADATEASDAVSYIDSITTFDPITTVTITAGNANIDLSVGRVFEISVTGNFTVTLLNMATSISRVFTITTRNTGSFNITSYTAAGYTIKAPSGTTAGTLTASGIDRFTCQIAGSSQILLTKDTNFVNV